MLSFRGWFSFPVQISSCNAKLLSLKLLPAGEGALSHGHSVSLARLRLGCVGVRVCACLRTCLTASVAAFACQENTALGRAWVPTCFSSCTELLI